MTVPSHITVTAPPGRVTPIHHLDGRGPAEAGVIIRVRFAGSHTIRRSIARGDLIPCTMAGSVAPSIELAAAPDELPEPRLVIERIERKAKP